MHLSIIIPSLRERRFKEFKELIEKYTDVDYELLENHEPGILYEIINKEFRKAKGKYVLLICDDCRVSKGWASKMLDFLDQEDEMTIGNYTIYMEKKSGTVLTNPVYYYGKLCSIVPCVRRSAIKENYLLDPRYKRFYGDVDLSMRFWAKGGQVKTCPGATVTLLGYRDEMKKKAINDYHFQDEVEFNNQWKNYDFDMHGNTQASRSIQEPMLECA